jgi:hypothetical protein
MDVRFCERRDHSREAPDARAKDLDLKSARSRERAWPRVFFLDTRLTWMSVSRPRPPVTTFEMPTCRHQSGLDAIAIWDGLDTKVAF